VFEHFDAIRIGLTATPASHTTAYFQDIVYKYEYERAVREGYLVDYDVVKVASGVRMQGVFLREGENIGQIDPETGSEQLDRLAGERTIPAEIADAVRSLLHEHAAAGKSLEEVAEVKAVDDQSVPAGLPAGDLDLPKAIGDQLVRVVERNKQHVGNIELADSRRHDVQPTASTYKCPGSSDVAYQSGEQ